MCLFFSGFLDFFFSGFLDFLRAPILFLSSIDGVAKSATRISLVGFGQKSRFRLADKVFYDEIHMLINRWLWKKGRRKFNKTRQNMFDSIRMIACDYCHSESCPIQFRFIFSTLKMSSDVVYNCATCSKTVKGKQDYAICIKCSRC